jgi:putative addiction module component (TIGR02574 family)
MSSLQEIYEAAQTLPTGDRTWLIHALWEGMEPKDWPQPDRDWIAEAQRRSEQLDSGQMAAAPWSEVRQRVRRQAGLDG